jgi:hypothetical protein
MVGISRVAQQLLAFQEGLCSMEFVKFISCVCKEYQHDCSGVLVYVIQHSFCQNGYCSGNTLDLYSGVPGSTIATLAILTDFSWLC